MPGGEVLRFDLPPTAAVANLTGAATAAFTDRRPAGRVPYTSHSAMQTLPLAEFDNPVNRRYRAA